MSLGPILDDLPFSKIIILPDFGNPQSQWVSVREVGSNLGLEMRRNLLISSNMLLKRAMDLCLAVMLAVPALPIVAVCGFLVKLASPGPVFYYQSREGLDGRTFRLWKIRTMVVGADQQLETVIGQSADLGQEWQRRMKLRVDPRIIPGVGHFLRRWSLDELPQLWNVILGDMSISGPRPLPCYHLDALTKDTCKLRRKVRPGITGLSQVSGRSSLLLEENSILDTYYVRNWSLWLDLHIITRTIRAIVRGQGAY
jgi:lipopolysaccharide/colanic/teichoic acid biosynthesis glycosyltransferase